MSTTILVVFAVVYVGMVLGRLPRLQLDRTGVALLGAIALVATGSMSLEDATRSIDVPTIAVLFSFMVVSAQLRLGGFYTRVISAVTARRLSPAALLGVVIVVTGALSAVFTNDIVCLAAAPVLIGACRRRGLNPVPFLLALACASNVGSAATLIGNPQNILIGQVLGLSFAGYLLDAGIPALLGLGVTWAVVARRYARRWHVADPIPERAPENDAPAWNAWQASKGIAATLCLLLAFLITSWPRELLALGAAGALLCSRRLHSRQMLGLVDWQLLVLFIGLFIVNRAVQLAGWPEWFVGALGRAGVDPGHPPWLFAITAFLSNAVSNVPAVMLLLPFASSPFAGPVLALSSTLAGNLLIVGSIANIIVVGSAAAHGITIDWRCHARTGVVVTALTLAVAAAFLALRYAVS
jgi:Na+/H+ antiporter NhaD/arsenite permease-like protein